MTQTAASLWREGLLNELIQELGMTKGAASKVVSRLEEKGLAERQLADGRSREQSLVLTASGMRARGQGEPIVGQFNHP